jgi:hypothetical protein
MSWNNTLRNLLTRRTLTATVQGDEFSAAHAPDTMRSRERSWIVDS